MKLYILEIVTMHVNTIYGQNETLLVVQLWCKPVSFFLAYYFEKGFFFSVLSFNSYKIPDNHVTCRYALITKKPSNVVLRDRREMIDRCNCA